MFQKGRHKPREYSISSYCIPYVFLWIHYCLFYKKCHKFQEKQMNFATFSGYFRQKLPLFPRFLTGNCHFYANDMLNLFQHLTLYFPVVLVRGYECEEKTNFLQVFSVK